MKIIQDITAEEMVSVFLIGELNSLRWGKKIEKILITNKIPKKVITEPKIGNKKEDQKRALVLGEFRGYGKKGGLFDDLEKVMAWKRVVLDKEDFLKIKYIDYDYWNEISGKTGLVMDGVKNVKAGLEIFGVSNRQYWQVAEVVKNGGKFPNIILLMDTGKNLKLLEGHVRLTGYLLANNNPKPIEAIVGMMSGKMKPRSESSL